METSFGNCIFNGVRIGVRPVFDEEPLRFKDRCNVGRLCRSDEGNEGDSGKDQAFHAMRVPTANTVGAYLPTAARTKNATLAGRSAILRVRYGYQAVPYGT